MSTYPEPAPNVPEDSPNGRLEDAPSTDPLAPENLPTPPGEWTGEPEEPGASSDTTNFIVTPATLEPQAADVENPPPLFVSYTRPPTVREERIPHAGHLALLALLGIFGSFGAEMLVLLAVKFHLWGISKLSQAATDYHYTLGNEAAQYFITFAGCLVVFPAVWQRPFFDGIHWNGDVALQRIRRLVGAAIVCFFAAMINGILMPGPVNAPIDELFRAPGAAWVLFGFGVTLAPFFEEMAFRGFLLPSLCTAFDWVARQFPSGKPQMFDAAGRPEWGPGASVWAMVIIGIPFLALIPHPAVHLFERILFVLVWASAMALWWGRTLARNRSVDPPIDGHYHPRWSIPAMGAASVFTSVPFAMLHGAQTSWSLGPFLLLIFVSLVLCWIRLSTRSLAASTMVHAFYNFMLFSLMLFHTSGFKHLDRI